MERYGRVNLQNQEVLLLEFVPMAPWQSKELNDQPIYYFLDTFEKTMIGGYESACRQTKLFEAAPTVNELVDYTQDVFLQISSIYLMEEPFAYLNLTPKEKRSFLEQAEEKYAHSYRHDVYRMANRMNLFTQTGYDTFINKPGKEVW